jgi:hypothetical protein
MSVWTIAMLWVALLAAIFVYFVPYIVAKRRGCRAKDGIAALNLFGNYILAESTSKRDDGGKQ